MKEIKEGGRSKGRVDKEEKMSMVSVVYYQDDNLVWKLDCGV